MAITTTQQRTLLRARDELLELLRATAREREVRGELVDGEPAWVRHERATMHAAVNQRRAAAGLPPVPLTAVERVEHLAVGHIDYASKFALGCAELACGLEG